MNKSLAFVKSVEEFESLGDKAIFALENVVLGILMVFAVLSVLCLTIKLSAIIIGKLESAASQKSTPDSVSPTAPAETPTPTTVAETDDGATIAAITAAIALLLESEASARETSPSGFRVVSFRRSDSPKN